MSIPSPADPALPPFLRREATEQLPLLQEVVERVVRSGRFLFGGELSAFERELAAAVGSPHAVGVGSGTDAIQLALRALGVGAGDRVLTQSHSSPFTVIAIHMTGAHPVLVESSADDFGMDLDALRAALRDGAAAVLPVHLYGHPVRIEEIVELAGAVPVVEDCAQAQGATVGGRQVGTFGAIGCFSFYPTKNLGALGDGGGLVTADAALAERVRRLRNGGLVAPGLHAERGITSRLNEVQAGVLRLRLARLEAANDARRRHAEGYLHGLRGVRLPRLRAGCVWAPHQLVIRHRDREELRRRTAAAGWPLLVHYPLPVHLQEGFRDPSYPPGRLPVAETLAAQVVSLPTHPSMTVGERAMLIDVVNRAAAGGTRDRTAEDATWGSARS